MNVTILAVGKLKDRFYEEGCGEYQKRLARYCTLSVREAADERADEPPGVEADHAGGDGDQHRGEDVAHGVVRGEELQETVFHGAGGKRWCPREGSNLRHPV